MLGLVLALALARDMAISLEQEREREGAQVPINYCYNKGQNIVTFTAGLNYIRYYDVLAFLYGVG